MGKRAKKAHSGVGLRADNGRAEPETRLSAIRTGQMGSDWAAGLMMQGPHLFPTKSKNDFLFCFFAAMLVDIPELKMPHEI